MTEIYENSYNQSQTVQDFVLRWGDMGSQWGVNRSVAQIHALLFLNEKPMHAEEISSILGIARSNVSNSIKELLNWKLIEKTPVNGDRRDHFVAEADVMTIFRLIVHGRMEREIDPTLHTLKRCMEQAKKDNVISGETKRRLEEMNTFVTSANAFYLQMQEMPNSTLSTILRMGTSVLKYIPGLKGG